MNIIEKTDEEILELAHPMWADLVKYSNEQNYGAFTRNFSSSLIKGANEVEMGRQFARSDLAQNLSEDYDYLGMIRRGEYVTVLYKSYKKGRHEDGNLPDKISSDMDLFNNRVGVQIGQDHS